MNALDLAQRLHLILRVGEGVPGSEPSAFDGQTGVLGEIVNYIKASYDDIIRLHPDWLFLEDQLTATLAATQRVITRATLSTAADPDVFDFARTFVSNNAAFVLIRPPGGAECPVWYVSYQSWNGHVDAATLPSGMPTRFTITPAGELLFDSFADRDYEVRLPYRKGFTQLEQDDDEPVIPVDHHLTIVWWAVVNYYCLTREDVERLRQRASEQLSRELTNLRNRWLPSITI